jgi:hypothetical protein
MLVLLAMSSCQRNLDIDLGEKKNDDENELEEVINSKRPSVTTSEVLVLGPNEASCRGTVTADYGLEVTVRGIVYSTSDFPSLTTGNKTVDGSGIGTFNSTMTNLQTGLKYYVRAYATNSAGTSYGTAMSFTTEEAPQSNMSLNGKWLADGGTGVEIAGNSGKFYAFNSAWKQAEAAGLARIGDVKFKNIEQLTANRWKFIEFVVKRTEGVPVQKIWSENGTITMGSNGKSINVTSTSLLDGAPVTLTSTYNRQ